MKLNLSSAYSLCITISLELTDVSIQIINPKDVNAVELIMFSLATYYLNIIVIFMILMFAGKMGV